VFAPTGQLVKSIGGFTIPQGIAVSRNWLLVADAGTRELVAVSLVNYERQTVLMNAPIGSPRGGPMRAAFCSITADADGNFYVGCNGDGVVRRIRRTRD
jgi:sugar lactone lactonase YvrE